MISVFKYIDNIDNIWWVPIPSIIYNIKPYYCINNNGEVYSAYSGKILTPICIEDYWYYHLSTLDGKGTTVRANRLMMISFNYFPGCEYYQVNHIDGDKNNNSLSNLEWCTAQYNTLHAISHGLRTDLAGENNPHATMTNNIARKVYDLLISGVSDHDISTKLHIPLSVIQNMARGNTWNSIFSEQEIFNMKCTRRGSYLTDAQYHQICKYYQDHNAKYTEYGRVSKMARDALSYIGLNINDTLFKIAKRLYYRYDRNDITDLYIY